MRHFRTLFPAVAATAAAGLLPAASAFAHTTHPTPAVKPAPATTPKPAAKPAPAAATSAARQTVKLRFRAVAGDAPVRCGTPIEGLGSTGTAAQLQDLRFFVSNVKLVRKDGSTATVRVAKTTAYRVAGSTRSLTLIDLEDATGGCAAEGNPTTNATVIGTVPRGNYVGARWTLGVPFALNHTDTVGASGPLARTDLAWSWQFGRLFTKIEFADPGGAAGSWGAKQFFVHLGSTGCTGNPANGETASCKAPNRSEVRLPRLNLAKQDIAVDVRALLAGTDVTKNGGGAPGCMSGPTDPECPGIFSALGVTWSADGSATGKPSGKQTLFRAITR